MPSTQQLSSLSKAIDILVSVCNGVSRIADIERALGYNKTTIYRVLNTFEAKKLIIKIPETRQYFPGHYLFSLLAEPLKSHQILIHCVQVELERLRDQLDETIALMIPQGANRFLLNSIHTNGQVRFFANVGILGPLYDGLAGRVLLSQYSDQELEGMFKNTAFHSSNPNTPKDEQTLMLEIKKIRRQGYGSTHRGRNHSTMAVSVPVYGYFCPVAIVTAGFKERIRDKHQFIIDCFKEISTKLTNQINNQINT